MNQVHGDSVLDGAMRTCVVVVLAPSFDLSSGALDVEETVLVQTCQTEAAVKGLAAGVIRWLSGSREVEDDAVGVGPVVDPPNVGRFMVSYTTSCAMRKDSYCV